MFMWPRTIHFRPTCRICRLFSVQSEISNRKTTRMTASSCGYRPLAADRGCANERETGRLIRRPALCNRAGHGGRRYVSSENRKPKTENRLRLLRHVVLVHVQADRIARDAGDEVGGDVTILGEESLGVDLDEADAQKVGGELRRHIRLSIPIEHLRGALRDALVRIRACADGWGLGIAHLDYRDGADLVARGIDDVHALVDVLDRAVIRRWNGTGLRLICVLHRKPPWVGT